MRSIRGCKDQVVAVRRVREKQLVNWNDLFWIFMDLEKAYDTIDKLGMLLMLRVYGVDENCRKQCRFYADSMACVRVGMDVNEWFPINVSLSHGCVMSVMSPWLFNIYGLWCEK